MLGGWSIWLVAMLAVVLAPAAQRHYGWSDYDVSRAITLDGVVEAIAIDASFVELCLRVGAISWTVLLPSSAVLARCGKPVGAIAPGDRLMAVGFMARAGDRQLRAARITHDGRTVDLNLAAFP